MSELEMLRNIARRVEDAGCDVWLWKSPGDVWCLQGIGNIEVVCASGGYDLWRQPGSQPAGFNVSAEDAARAMIEAAPSRWFTS